MFGRRDPGGHHLLRHINSTLIGQVVELLSAGGERRLLVLHLDPALAQRMDNGRRAIVDRELLQDGRDMVLYRLITYP